MQEIQEVQKKCRCLNRHGYRIFSDWLYFLYFFIYLFHNKKIHMK
jgi:hypothetical protein